MKSAPIIFGSIFYIDHRKIFSTSGSEEICLFERLSQCLDSPEKSGFRWIINAGSLFGNGEPVSLFCQIRFLFHTDKGTIVGGITDGKRKFLFQGGFQQLRRGSRNVLADSHILRKRDNRFFIIDSFRQRHHRQAGGHSLRVVRIIIIIARQRCDRTYSQQE